MRASIKKGLINYINNEGADIFHFQEIKIAKDDLKKIKFSEKLNDSFFQYSFCATSRRGYSGLLTITKEKPQSVIKGIGSKDFDKYARVLRLEFEQYNLINVYFPHTGRKLEKIDYKMSFNQKFKEYVKNLTKPSIISGDFNVAHTKKDIKRAKENEGNAGFTKEERDYFSELLDAGFIDSFRYLHPIKEKYTWWLQNFNARDRNVGWRIDYHLVDKELKSKIKKSDALNDVYGSDHCPIVLEI